MHKLCFDNHGLLHPLAQSLLSGKVYPFIRLPYVNASNCILYCIGKMTSFKMASKLLELRLGNTHVMLKANEKNATFK